MNTTVARDERILRAVRMELELCHQVDAERLSVAVFGGAVTLSGEVRGNTERVAAIRCGRRINGVTDVVDGMRAVPKALASVDQRLARAARACIRSVLGGAGNLSVSVVDRRISVSGSVPEPVHCEALISALSELPGARSVSDDIDVIPRGSETDVADRLIRDRILAELRSCAQVSDGHIGVAVVAGTVELSGMVRDEAERKAALSSAFRVPGVHSVADEILIQDWASVGSDVSVAAEVRADLLWNEKLRGAHIDSQVTDGVVTLQGRANSEEQHDSARRSISYLSGVRAVDDLIELLPAARHEAMKANSDRAK